MNFLNLSKKIANILEKKLAEDIVVLDVSNLTVITEYFIIANFKTVSHANAIKDELSLQLSKDDIIFKRIEDLSDNWKIIDYNGIVVHLFDKQTRDFYNLDKLWTEAKIIEYV